MRTIEEIAADIAALADRERANKETFLESTALNYEMRAAEPVAHQASVQARDILAREDYAHCQRVRKLMLDNCIEHNAAVQKTVIDGFAQIVAAIREAKK